MLKVIRNGVICGAVLGLVAGLAGCGGKKNVKLELTKEDLEVHRNVLVVGAGPISVNLDVGMAGKLVMKGLKKILENDSDSSFAEDLRAAGLLPRDTAVEAGVAVLQELGWTVTRGQLVVEDPGKKFEEIKAPDGACEEAATAGADSVLVLYQRLTIDVGATEALARSELWAHLFDCPTKRPMWRGRDKSSLSLKSFILEAAKQVIGEKNQTLAGFLGSLRNLVTESNRKVLKAGMSR
jgi:hypothetical protein